MIKVTQLTIYPIKGCKGIPVTSAPVHGTGLPYDRQWVVVHEDSGKFITQRQIPKLCQVCVSLPPEALLGAAWGKLQPGAALVLSAPGMPQLQVPLTDPAASAAAAANIRRVTVWYWTGAAADEGDEAAQWFSSYLGKPVRLVRHLGGTVPDSTRPATAEFAPGHDIKFADGFPLLVAVEENLSALNAALVSGGGSGLLPMNRFRPNIVLSGLGSAWEDDGWKSIAIGGAGAAAAAGHGGDGGHAGAWDGAVVLEYVKPCSRCKVTTIDQATAEVGDQPLKMLSQFRSGKVLGWADQRKQWTHEVFFGWNAAVLQQGSISVGDAVAVVAHFPPGKVLC